MATPPPSCWAAWQWVGEKEACLHLGAHQRSRVTSQTRACGNSRRGRFVFAHSVPSGVRAWSRGLGAAGEAGPAACARLPPGCAVILTLVLFLVGLSHSCSIGNHRGAAGLSLGPCRAQPRLVQGTVEHHVGQDGDFQLLFGPVVLFGKFEFLWRSQVF